MSKPSQMAASELALMELVTIFLDASETESETCESSRHLFRCRLMELYDAFERNVKFDERNADAVSVLGEAVHLIGDLLRFTAEFAKGNEGQDLTAAEILKFISLEMQS